MATPSALVVISCPGSPSRVSPLPNLQHIAHIVQIVFVPRLLNTFSRRGVEVRGECCILPCAIETDGTVAARHPSICLGMCLQLLVQTGANPTMESNSVHHGHRFGVLINKGGRGKLMASNKVYENAFDDPTRLMAGRRHRAGEISVAQQVLFPQPCPQCPSHARHGCDVGLITGPQTDTQYLPHWQHWTCLRRMGLDSEARRLEHLQVALQQYPPPVQVK